MGLPHVSWDDLQPEIRLWFLALFHSDIRQSKVFASDAIALAANGQDDQDSNGWYCRTHDAAIVRYARCFLSCRLPDGKAATKAPDRYKFDEPLATIHERVMTLRHVIVAYADMRNRQLTLTKLPK